MTAEVVRPIVRIDDETTREQLAEVLTHLVADAKAMRRRGLVGTLSVDYARQHARIDHVLGDWLEAPT